MRAVIGFLLIGAFAFVPLAAAQESTATVDEERAFEAAFNDDPSDDAEARRVLEAAAVAGRPEAMNALANMVGHGAGGPRDSQRAFDLLMRAAELGSIGANTTLADYYGYGLNGFPREPERGLRHAIAATEADGPPRAIAWAQWRLAKMYLNGVGTPIDFVRAYEWASRSADGGSVSGMSMRASMLALGQGVAENDVEARVWYQRAAESRQPGSAQALYSLGGMLMTGEGGPSDMARGYAYLQLAQQGGDARADRAISAFQRYVDEASRAQASAIMDDWEREHGEPISTTPGGG